MPLPLIGNLWPRRSDYSYNSDATIHHGRPPQSRRAQIIVLDRQGIDQPLSRVELYDVFRLGHDDRAQWYRAARQTLLDTRSEAINRCAAATDPDSRARAAGAIDALDEVLADWNDLATMPVDLVREAVEADAAAAADTAAAQG